MNKTCFTNLLNKRTKMNKIVLMCAVVLFTCTLVLAQQPFEEYGYKVKVATLSKGKYNEFFDQDTLVQIGSSVLNLNTGKLEYFVSYDTVYSEATLQPDLISRWINPDPHSDEYFSLSPYNAFANNPILFTDPDGRDIIFYILTGDQEKSELKKVNFNQLDKNFKKALTAFAKTKEGYAYLSQFASKGDKIGDIEFKADGKFAKHDLGLTQESETYGAAGRNSFTWGKAEDGSTKAEFYLMVNTKNAEGNRDETSMALTFGHEAFIHIDQYNDRVVDAANKNDKSTLGKIANERMESAFDRNGGKDHDAYLDKNPKYQKMYNYTTQLKSIYNPVSVDKAKQSHDRTLKRTYKKQ